MFTIERSRNVWIDETGAGRGGAASLLCPASQAVVRAWICVASFLITSRDPRTASASREAEAALPNFADCTPWPPQASLALGRTRTGLWIADQVRCAPEAP